jgi:hypothetical protein
LVGPPVLEAYFEPTTARSGQLPGVAFSVT